MAWARKAIALALVTLPVLAGCTAAGGSTDPAAPVVALRIDTPVHEPVWSDHAQVLLALTETGSRIAKIDPLAPAGSPRTTLSGPFSDVGENISTSPTDNDVVYLPQPELDRVAFSVEKQAAIAISASSTAGDLAKPSRLYVAEQGTDRLLAVEAQHAVDTLSDQRFPVDRLAIVGAGLQSFEQITGRRGYRDRGGAPQQVRLRGKALAAQLREQGADEKTIDAASGAATETHQQPGAAGRAVFRATSVGAANRSGPRRTPDHSDARRAHDGPLCASHAPGGSAHTARHWAARRVLWPARGYCFGMQQHEIVSAVAQSAGIGDHASAERAVRATPVVLRSRLAGSQTATVASRSTTSSRW